LQGKRRCLMKRRTRKYVVGYIFMFPFIIFFSVLWIYPIIFGITLSLFEFRVFTEANIFVGARNYIELFTDEIFYKVVGNTLKFLGTNIPIMLGFALIVALMFDRIPEKLSRFMRTIYYIPTVIAVTVIAIIFSTLFSFKFGLINHYLNKIGIASQPWLTDPGYTIYAIALVNAWRGVGFYSIIFLAGLQSIPPSLHEAAALEGASRWQRFWYITLPMLNPVLFFCIVMATIWGFQIFIEPYVMTQGGPLYSSTTFVLYLYLQGFRFMRMGYAATIGIVLSVIILSVVIIQRKYISREEIY